VYNSKLLTSEIVIDTQFNDLQKVHVRKGELLQVSSNLIANAADAMRQGGKLEISTQQVVGPAGDGVETVIKDNKDNGMGSHRNTWRRSSSRSSPLKEISEPELVCGSRNSLSKCAEARSLSPAASKMETAARPSEFLSPTLSPLADARLTAPSA
jgi:hypothetical protein